jgi:APA family basic amino acid/polyamine antiporter
VNDEPPSRLVRRLGTGDAVVIGLGSMIGAGVFSAIGPAAEAAGSGLLVGLGIAALVACCNAASSAQLAAVHPASGGTYVYGREQLGHVWGFLAGWGFVAGKAASCAAMAWTFGSYAAPGAARPLAIGAVVALTLVNLAGVQKTVWATRVIVVTVIAALVVGLVAATTAGLSASRLGPVDVRGGSGILESAGLMFFAFAGYARIATLAEEVRNPRRTIPRAIPIALGITLTIYAAVAVVSLMAVGPDTLAASSNPLVAVAQTGHVEGAATIVRIGAIVGSLGVLLSLLVGVSRTTFAMAAERDLPPWLGVVDPVRSVPRRAELSIAALVIVVIAVADVRGAIGFSSFGVLVYYAIANASAWTLTPAQRRWPRSISLIGLIGCIVVAASLPTTSVVGGLALFGLGAAIWLVKQSRSRR